jgi:enhancing lycopene biosynthesis protein 2
MAKRIGVLLSGCGYLDGAEIHEATLSLYFLDKAGAEIVALAPDRAQLDVVDHQSGQGVGETRNARVEAARIARGDVRDVAEVRAEDLDALVIPGGYGAAKTLSSFATEGDKCSVEPAVERLLRALHQQKKPIGALCIAPAVVARVLGPDFKVELTIGDDAGTARALEAMGARHVSRKVEEIHVDAPNRVVSTPCYMLATGPAQVAAGVEKLVAQIMTWLG